jgi:hypothetical protein
MNQDLIENFKWAAPPGQDGRSPYFWIWIGVAVLVLLVGLIVFTRYRRGRGMPFIAPPQPHVTALRSLDDLEALLTEGNEREFTQAVSDIVRIYIQDRFGLRAPHRSTEEFLFEASTSGQLSDPDQELLAEFLVQCDQVKFARQVMKIDAMRAMLDAATHPKPAGVAS